MLLGVILMLRFGILEKNRKSAKSGKSGYYRAPYREPMLRRGRGTKIAPLGYVEE